MVLDKPEDLRPFIHNAENVFEDMRFGAHHFTSFTVAGSRYELTGAFGLVKVPGTEDRYEAVTQYRGEAELIWVSWRGFERDPADWHRPSLSVVNVWLEVLPWSDTAKRFPGAFVPLSSRPS